MEIQRPPQITVSSDVVGFLGDPLQAQKLYESAGFANCDVEVILMPFQYSRLVNNAACAHLNFRLGGVHGQIGDIIRQEDNYRSPCENLKIKLADALLPGITDIAGIFDFIPAGQRVEALARQLEKPIYYNVHNDIVHNRLDDFQNFATKTRFSYLTIENGPSKGDIARTRDLVHQLRDQGAYRTSGTFDLVHAIREESGDPTSMTSVAKVWGKVLSQLQVHDREPVFLHMHLPIGLYSDSLPIEAMLAEGRMIPDLVQTLAAPELRKPHTTIENEHDLLKGVTNKALERLRLIRIRQGLLACGMQV